MHASACCEKLPTNVALRHCGNQVTEIREGRCAEEAGIAVGDTILEVNGEAVSTMAALSKLVKRGTCVQRERRGLCSALSASSSCVLL